MVKKKGVTKKLLRLTKKQVLFAVAFLTLIISSILLISMSSAKVVIYLDNEEYTVKDFNMYVYFTKLELFGVANTNLSEDELNTQISNDSETTLKEYLKDKAIEKMKLSSSILRLAKNNNITLDNDDEKEIEEEREEFISSLGGNAKYSKLLKNNRTNNDAYLKLAHVNKLYDKVFEQLYAEGKRNDITSEEIANANNSYLDYYVKFKQIVLLKKDLDNDAYLNDATLNQKEALANSIIQTINKDNFDEYIIKYSDLYSEKVESEYYVLSDMLDEIQTSIESMKVGDISGVVSTDYAYHIILKEELDDSKLSEYLNLLREEKLGDDLLSLLNEVAIRKGRYFDKITVK